MRRGSSIRSKRTLFPLLGLLGLALVSAGPAAEPIDRALAAVIPAAKPDIKAKLKNWGLFNKKSVRSHIQAVDAWKIEEGSHDVIVAVIDTGIDPKHRDLSANLWKDGAKGLQPLPGREKRSLPKSAIATRRSATEAEKQASLRTTGQIIRQRILKRQKEVRKQMGLPQTVFGWDFVTNTPNPADDHGHGTHVAGIIGAVANPEAGVAGVAHQVSIMPVKYYSAANPGSVNLANTVKAINYAVEKGAKIINYSGGGPEFSEAEYLAIRRAQARGVLFVAAAGNEHQDIDQPKNYYYPSAYGLPNILSVAATDEDNKLLSSSNWGKNKVDVAAPGEDIYSTLPGNKYGKMSGTSQATAFVSGIAALLLSKAPELTPTQLKRLISESVDPVPHLKSKVRTGGRVNALKALKALEAHQKRQQQLAAI